MTSFNCPHCDDEVKDGDIPDHVREAAESGKGKFNYECQNCGCVFDVLVEWDPDFTVVEESIQLPGADAP